METGHLQWWKDTLVHGLHTSRLIFLNNDLTLMKRTQAKLNALYFRGHEFHHNAHNAKMELLWTRGNGWEVPSCWKAWPFSRLRLRRVYWPMGNRYKEQIWKFARGHPKITDVKATADAPVKHSEAPNMPDTGH